MGATKEQREAGRNARELLIGFLSRDPEWGELRLERISYLVPRDAVGSSSQKRIVTRYSVCHWGAVWWYDVKEKDWQRWQNDWWLAFLLAENNKLNFVLLEPSASIQLLDRIKPKGGNAKTIHIKRDEVSGKLVITEWEELPLREVTISDKSI